MGEAFSRKARRWLHILGAALSVLALIFVVFKFLDYRGQINFSQYTSRQWLLFFMASIAYGVSGVLLAFAWRLLLRRYEVRVTRLWATWAYGVSQLIKYVPGNIFHLAGRQVIGMAAGFPGSPLAKSAFWEIALIASMGSVFLPLILPLLGGRWLVGVLFFGLASMGVLLLWRRIGSKEFFSASVLYLFFLSLSAAFFLGLIEVFCDACYLPLDLWIPVMGAYVIAWLVGLVTPGSPAGLGVREVVLYSLLQSWIEQADLLMIVALGRLMTLIGDVLFFFTALLIRKIFSRAGSRHSAVCTR